MSVKKNAHICILIDAWEPLMGGGQIHVREVAARLIKNHNCSVDIFTRSLIDDSGHVFSKIEVDPDHKYTVYRLGPAGRFNNFFLRIIWLFIAIFPVLKNHKKNPYHLLHAQTFLPAIPGKIITWLTGLPLIYTVHGTSIGRNQNTFLEKVERWLVTGIKYDQEISVANNFLKFSNVNKNIKIISNGVDVDSFDKITIAKNKIFTLIWVGRFDSIKGLSFLIKALADLSNEDFMLNLYGSGDEEANIRSLVKESGLDKKVYFKGRVEGQELMKAYKSSHLFILPSLSEGQPLTLLEALSAKLPVIATDVGDNQSIISRSEAGLIVEPRNPDALSQAITKILQIYKKSPADFNKMGENGYNFVKANYSWEKTTDKVYQIYTHILKNDQTLDP